MLTQPKAWQGLRAEAELRDVPRIFVRALSAALGALHAPWLFWVQSLCDAPCEVIAWHDIETRPLARLWRRTNPASQLPRKIILPSATGSCCFSGVRTPSWRLEAQTILEMKVFLYIAQLILILPGCADSKFPSGTAQPTQAAQACDTLLSSHSKRYGPFFPATLPSGKPSACPPYTPAAGVRNERHRASQQGL